MAKGTPTTQTQTSRVELTPQQTELLNYATPYAKQFATKPPVLPAGSGVAGADPMQAAGQAAALAQAPAQGSLATSGANATNRILSEDFLHPESNPALKGAIDAATRPIREQFLTSTLPQIRGGAVVNGQYGSSRQGIAEGIAARGAASAMGDVASNVANQGYQTGLAAQNNTMGLLPQTIGAQLAPALTTSGVGDVRQAQAQREMDATRQNDLWNQLKPLMMAQELTGLATGMPGATTINTGPGPTQPSVFQRLLGGASTGVGLGTALAPMLGAAGGPIGLGIGALLGLMG